VAELAHDDPRHGTTNGYSNLRCRCTACKAAWAADCLARRARRKARLAQNTTVEHGTESTYTNHGCRCRPCTDAQADAARRRTSAR
jgi:hypothetical protein